MSGDLIAFLSARLDEDETTAEAATDGPWYADGCEIRGHNRAYAGGEPGILVVKHTWPQESAHIVRHDPDRERREVAARRALIMRYERACTIPEPCVSFTAGQDDGYRQACMDAISDFAAVYSSHPDYRQEWTV